MGKLKNIEKKVYKHLEPFERDEIACMLSAGYNQKEIAAYLCRQPSTISNEIKRNGSKIRNTRYRANRAQLRADQRKKSAHIKKRLKSDDIKEYVIEKLMEGYTPEQIAGRIGIDNIFLFIMNALI